MKKIGVILLFVFVFVWVVFCSSYLVKTAKVINSVSIDSTAYYKASYNMLSDSIVKLKQRPVMTIDQFVILYKYDRLLKYYKICKHKPTQWKYYKGWSTRVFEQ